MLLMSKILSCINLLELLGSSGGMLKIQFIMYYELISAWFLLILIAPLEFSLLFLIAQFMIVVPSFSDINQNPKQSGGDVNTKTHVIILEFLWISHFKKSSYKLYAFFIQTSPTVVS